MRPVLGGSTDGGHFQSTSMRFGLCASPWQQTACTAVTEEADHSATRRFPLEDSLARLWAALVHFSPSRCRPGVGDRRCLGEPGLISAQMLHEVGQSIRDRIKLLETV